MASLFQSIGMNLEGNDYICSDIHGHFSLLQETLDSIGFDANIDRLFSLGDLIDRGAESKKVLQWLAYDWFYAIQGNHERMLINAIEKNSEQLFLQWYAWGGAWAVSMSRTDLEEIYKALTVLPVAIELELCGAKKVGLVHAELPDICSWNEIKNVLKNTASENVESDPLVSNMLWKKSQPYRDVDGILSIEPVAEIDHVFHGHTIVDQITTYANRTFMDLGSYLNNRIGVINPIDFT